MRLKQQQKLNMMRYQHNEAVYEFHPKCSKTYFKNFFQWFSVTIWDVKIDLTVPSHFLKKFKGKGMVGLRSQSDVIWVTLFKLVIRIQISIYEAISVVSCTFFWYSLNKICPFCNHEMSSCSQQSMISYLKLFLKADNIGTYYQQKL